MVTLYNLIGQIGRGYMVTLVQSNRSDTKGDKVHSNNLIGHIGQVIW